MLKFLIALDGSPPSLRALEAVGRMARSGVALEVVLLNVRDTTLAPSDQLSVDDLGALAAATAHDQRHLLNAAESSALGCGLQVSACVACAGVPAQEIVRAAASHRVDQIVMGAHGKQALAGGSLLPGSVAQHVLCLTKVPVLLVP